MAVPVNPSAFVVAGIAVLIAWRMYSRMRRLIGRQRLSRVRPWVSVTLFPALVLLLASAAFARPEALAMLAAGLVVGAALGTWGLKLTKFERTPEGFFYTPNMHLGIALSLLLAGRILYRLGQIYPASPGQHVHGLRPLADHVGHLRHVAGCTSATRSGSSPGGGGSRQRQARSCRAKISENAEVGRNNVAAAQKRRPRVQPTGA